MEINKKDLEVKLSNNVRKRYITQVKGNIYDSSELRDLKLKRNWILGKIIQDTETFQTRNYENLVMEVCKDYNIMTRIYNSYKFSECYNEDFETRLIHKEEVENILKIDKLEEKEAIIYLSGYKISKRFYKTYVIESDYTYKDYDELLEEAVDIIKHGEQFHSFSDKEMYRLYNNDTNSYNIVTLTEGIEITNMRWGVIYE